LPIVLEGRADNHLPDALTPAIVVDTSSQVKGRVPVSISYNIAPNAHPSARLSTILPCAYSGDIYAAVPTITPIRVAAAVGLAPAHAHPLDNAGPLVGGEAGGVTVRPAAVRPAAIPP